MRLLGALALSVVCAACVGTQGCGERRAPEVSMQAGPSPEAKAVAVPRGKLALRLVAMTDLSGYLRPCGCQSRPLGGIDKAAAQVAALRADAVPTLFVEAGDLLFGDTPEGATNAADAATQERWKAETLLQILDGAGLAAAAPGPRDLTYGVPELAELTKAAKLVLLPKAPSDPGAPEAVAGRVFEVGAVKLVVVGVSTFARPGNELPPEREGALIARTQAEVDGGRRAGAQLVIVLASASQRFGRRLAGGLKQTDFVVLGGDPLGAEAPPGRVGSTQLLRARSQGHGLLVVDLYADQLAAPTPFVDASAWTREAQRTDLKARVDDLAQRIAHWQRDANVNKADLDQQRAKLAELQAKLAAAGTRPSGERSFEARFIELAPEVAGDAEVGKRIDAYDARVNAHNQVAFKDVYAPKAAAGVASYVGSERCKGCHASEHAWWSKHPHGNAYATLVDVHKEFNLSCVACHVTGYMRPGGASLVHNEGLVNVGCESCHGAGSKHVASPDDEPALGMTRDPSAEICKGCHTPEHSDLFDYAKYRAKLIVPGHGLPLTAAGAGHAP